MLLLQQLIKKNGSAAVSCVIGSSNGDIHNSDKFYKFLRHMTRSTSTLTAMRRLSSVTSPVVTNTIVNNKIIPKQRQIEQQNQVSSQRNVYEEEETAVEKSTYQLATAVTTNAVAATRTNFKAFANANISQISYTNVIGCATSINLKNTREAINAHFVVGNFFAYKKDIQPINRYFLNIKTNLWQQKQRHQLLHTQSQQKTNAKQQQKPQQQHQKQQRKNKQQQSHFAMSSLAAEPQFQTAAAAETTTTAGITAMTPAASINSQSNGSDAGVASGDVSCHVQGNNTGIGDMITTTAGKNPCFNTGLAEILQFMELIGNLKHTKRTGWVLRDVNDCESISGHMYRMSMLTFLLDGSEGLNQIRCMELALVHDLAESLVGDITPFCGVSKEAKRNMELKAMEDICKLIEPRGKRIMELFEEYEHGESAESKFVKDLDRLDMVMQAFEYEKRDNCLLKHQEFFDSTEGKFKHPFVKKLVNEIYEQRKILAKAKGATPPPPVHVPSMSDTSSTATATVTAIVSNTSSSNSNGSS